MFTINHQVVNDFNALILYDDSSGTSATVLPDCGAILNAFTVKTDNSFLNIIDSYNSLKDFTESVTSKGFKGSKLSPFVCRLQHGEYHFAENTYKINKFYLGKHAIHGLLFDRGFQITNEIATEENATVSLLYQYKKEDSGYPFEYDCFITYKLEKNNKLTVTTKITNKDQGLIPIQDGWHPYFTFNDKIDKLQLEFQSNNIVVFNEDLLPTGQLKCFQEYGSLKEIGNAQLDNCFQLDFTECQPLCVLRDPEKKMQLEIYPESSYPYLQIYTPPHRTSIAIENLSGPPDAFNNGIDLKTLEPGQETEFVTSYKISFIH